MEEASTPDGIHNESTHLKKDFPFTITEKKDYGRGDVQVVQVLPPEIAALPEAERKKTHLFIYCQPWYVTGGHELERLLDDLQALAKSTQGAEPVRVIGVAYTGERISNSSRIVDRLPEGVKVTQLQVDKARDIVAAVEDLDLLEEGQKAEIIGYSAGGPVALLAAYYGVPIDTVGGFNPASLDNKGYVRTAAGVIVESIANALWRTPKERTDLIKLLENKENGHPNRYAYEGQESRSITDRAARSLSENIAVGRSKTHQLIRELPGVEHIIGKSKWDFIYPRRRTKKVLREVGASNITFVDLDWSGHHLESIPALRRERLGEIGQVMKNARESKGSA